MGAPLFERSANEVSVTPLGRGCAGVGALREVMSRHAGVLRSDAGLADAVVRLAEVYSANSRRVRQSVLPAT